VGYIAPLPLSEAYFYVERVSRVDCTYIFRQLCHYDRFVGLKMAVKKSVEISYISYVQHSGSFSACSWCNKSTAVSHFIKSPASCFYIDTLMF